RGEEARRRAADRVVDDVHAVRDGLVDRGHEVCGRPARSGVVGRLVERLVHRDPRARRHAADLAERGRDPGRLHAVVAAGRAGGVRTVTVEVTWREVLLRDDVVLPVARGKPLRADELLVAHRGVESLAGGALRVPARNLLVVKLAFDVVRVGARPVTEAQGFRPDAGVDIANDDVLTSFADAAELVPKTAR